MWKIRILPSLLLGRAIKQCLVRWQTIFRKWNILEHSQDWRESMKCEGRNPSIRWWESAICCGWHILVVELVEVVRVPVEANQRLSDERNAMAPRGICLQAWSTPFRKLLKIEQDKHLGARGPPRRSDGFFVSWLVTGGSGVLQMIKFA